MKSDKSNISEIAKRSMFNSRIFNWLKKYKWHFLVWFCLFIYGYTTDLLLNPTAYFTKVLIHFLTHHVLLFYSLLFCLYKFSSKTKAKIVLGIFRFVAVMGGFLLLRIFLNYEVFSVLDEYMGFKREKVNLSELNIYGLFWISEQSVRVIAFFVFQRMIMKQRQLTAVQKENFLQQIERLEEEKRTQQIEATLKTLETTFANLIHETKTPITLINNYLSDYIERHGSSRELDIIKTNVRKLSRDITNLLDLERFKRGIDLFDHNQIISISALLDSSIFYFASYCRVRRLRLVADIQESLYVKADPLSLNRILNNLIENAIKYSEENTQVSITLSCEDDKVILSVTNHSIEIESDSLADIFTPYSLLNKRKKNFQGMGLGLPMVKSIVDTLNGTISIQNIASGEIKASVVLPSAQLAIDISEVDFIGDSTLDNPVAAIPEEIIINPASPEILIVEDNNTMRHYLAGKLAIKYNIRTAVNGKDAIQQLKMRTPNLVLSDVMMDDLDGFEMIKAIRQIPDLHHLPIIFLTARSEERDKIKGLDLGAIDYIEKPFTMDIVLKKVESILSYTEQHRVKLYNDAYTLMRTLSGKGKQEDAALLVEPFDKKCEKYNLTKREKEITQLLLEGKSGRSIAELIFVSIKTVETHVSNIYEKVNVSNKVELMRLFQ